MLLRCIEVNAGSDAFWDLPQARHQQRLDLNEALQIHSHELLQLPKFCRRSKKRWEKTATNQGLETKKKAT